MNKIDRTCPDTFNIDKIGRIKTFDKNKKIIRTELSELTQLHCSYCDCLLHISEYTPHIEHFRPTKSYSNLKIVWHNLFVSCPKCNSIKGSQFMRKQILKPDKKGYSFDYWFQINWKTNEIEPNECRNDEEILKSEKTINLFGLNDYERPSARKKELKLYFLSPIHLNDYSYRFFIERAN